MRSARKRLRSLTVIGLAGLCVCMLWPVVGCRQEAGFTTSHPTTTGPTLTADLVPVSLVSNNLHAAKTFWLAAGDALEISNPQMYQFAATDPNNPAAAFTCMIESSNGSCVGPAGQPAAILPPGLTFSVDALEVPAQSANSTPVVVASFPITLSGLLPLDGQQFNTVNEDATYELRPSATLGITSFQGQPFDDLKVLVVPADMGGRPFTPTLNFNPTLPSGEKWEWSEDPSMWSENFGSSLQVTTISVMQGNNAIPFCGVTVQNQHCGCNGDQSLSTSCTAVDLRQCTNFNGLVVTPTYILSGVSGRLSDPNDRATWTARFAARGCGLTPPGQQQGPLLLNFTLVVR